MSVQYYSAVSDVKLCFFALSYLEMLQIYYFIVSIAPNWNVFLMQKGMFY